MLHIGGVRTALYCWLLAHQTGGQFILRIEDTDQGRYDERAEQSIMEALRWLGLHWDEGPDNGGPYAPYTQSLRKASYQEASDRLLESGAAYLCDCTSERLEMLRQRQEAAKQPPGYDGRCRTRPRAELEQARRDGAQVVTRLRVPDRGEITFQDVVHGEVTFDLSRLSDFVIMKSDGMPTYHLAHVIDDQVMKITHVIRGEEWISSTPRHVLLHRALGIQLPTYVHVPLILGKDRSKLSKRHGAAFALEYRDQGYLPDAVFNYLALLGWSTGDDSEIMSRDEITRRFSISRIQDHPAIFDAEKLEWMNGVYMRSITAAALADHVIPFLEKPERAGGLPDSVQRPLDRGYVMKLMPLVQERMKKLIDAVEFTDFFFKDEIVVDAPSLPGKGMDAASTASALEEALKLCLSVESFDAGELERRYRGLAESLGLKAGQLFGPIRVAITGKSVAPPLFDTLAGLGRERSADRLRKAIGLMRG